MRLLRWATTVTFIAFASVTSAAAQSPRPKPLERPSALELERGAEIFASSCGRCHGLDGSGGMGPPLTRPKLRRGGDDAAIIDIIMDGIPGTTMPASWSLSEAEVVRLAAYVRSLGRRPPETLPGDPAAGRTVYARLQCGTCHIVDGTGTAIGPELTNVGLLRGAAYLRESLFDPAATRPERPVPYEPYSYPAYVMVRLKPRGAVEIVGMRLNEDSFTIQLRDQSGHIRSFRKAELDSVQVERSVSTMPSYRGTLSDREADDLIAYLMTLGAQR